MCAAFAAIALGSAAAGADPVSGGSAAAHAIAIDLGGQEAAPPTPAVEAVAPPFADDQDETTIDIPAAPLAVSGTFIGKAAVHEASDLETTLGQPASAQAVDGPYNARAVGQIEALQVLIDEQVPGGQLLNAELITGEAVAVCRGGTVQYSASSEVVNLQIGDQDPLSGPLNELITQISEGISGSELAQLIDIDVNVVTNTPTGAAVDALVVTLLAAAGEAPAGQIRLGHAEVANVACGGDLPECSDTVDNADPEDTLADAADPGCHTDGDANNPTTYDPLDDDERDTEVLGGTALPKPSPGPLALTGGEVTTGLAALLGLAALATFALRRRLT
ncbi:MAG: hypothetical protein ACOYXM_11160 [Actinomycetota bacterium]